MNAANNLSRSARRVQDTLASQGVAFQVVELPDSTRTAQDAASAIGCTVGQIAKSLIFRGQETDQPILAITSGPNRVDEALLSHLAGEPIEQATPHFVRDRTGFAIGGVPPIGHTTPIATWIDEDLMQHEIIWAAAGTPHAVFDLDPTALPDLTGGVVTRLKA